MKTSLSTRLIVFAGLLLFFPLKSQINSEIKSTPAIALSNVALQPVVAPSLPISVPTQSAATVTVSPPTLPAVNLSTIPSTHPAKEAATMPATTVQQPAIAAASAATAAPATFQSKLAEVNARPVLLDKILGTKELLGQLSQASPQTDKDSFITACNNLATNQQLMKKNELTGLNDLLNTVLANTFLLTAAQRATMQQTAQTTTNLLNFAQEGQTSVATLKSAMGDKKNYDLALNATLCALNLLDTKLSPDEYSQSNPNGLVAMLRGQIPTLYNNRANKQIDLKILASIINIGQSKKEIADVIGKTWTNTLALDQALTQAQAQTNVLSQITQLQEMTKLIDAHTDRYERGLFVDMVTNIFNHRSERAAKEIDQFKTLITTITSASFQNNRVFDSSTATRFENWNKILDATSTLLALNAPQSTTQSVDQKITMLNSILPNVTLPGAEYEKTLFVIAFLNVFLKRTEITNTKPDVIKSFLIAVQNTTGLLSPSQLPMLQQWLDELGS